MKTHIFQKLHQIKLKFIGNSKKTKMSKHRIKTNDGIVEIEGKLSTNLFLDGQELFQGDHVFYISSECVIVWSTEFNGWCLDRIQERGAEIPIGEYGIPLTYLKLCE